MHYTIKPISTTYAGVNFRSRHEARWAAFFDLAGIKWDYEPLDLDGWAPDFLLRLAVGPVLCEVKPIDIDASSLSELVEAYDKAAKHAVDHRVLLIGSQPFAGKIGIAIHGDEPSDDFVAATVVSGAEAQWREAGNRTQWRPNDKPQSITTIVNNALRKAAA